MPSTSLRARAHRRAGDAEEQREHHDLKNLVGRHRLDDRARHQVRDELLHRERRDLEVGRGLRVGQRQVEIVAGTQHVDEDHTQQKRHQRGPDEPDHRLGADAADRFGVAHVRHTDDQRREHERRYDHLNQAQEDVGEQRDVIGDGLGGCRIGPQDMAGIADEDAEDHADEDDGRKPGPHVSPPSCSRAAARLAETAAGWLAESGGENCSRAGSGGALRHCGASPSCLMILPHLSASARVIEAS